LQQFRSNDVGQRDIAGTRLLEAIQAKMAERAAESQVSGASGSTEASKGSV